MLLQYLGKLSPERQEVFRQLKQFSANFVLAGGTAMMLQIGHRLSYDFDCFSLNPLSSNLLRQIKKVFGLFITPRIQTSEQITFPTKTGIEVTFVYHPYKLLQKPIRTDSMLLFGLDDLAANKAYVIGRRGVWRDYVDLFFFLKRKLYSIDRINRLAREKFKGEFNEKLFLEQLVYFDDVSVVPIDFIKESYDEKEIKEFLERKVEEYVQMKIH